MATGYGIRYLPIRQFIDYCAKLNVTTTTTELEHYEKVGVMLPLARLVYPEEYVQLSSHWPMANADEPPTQERWPELERLFKNPRVLPEHYADLKDEELIDSFDREMGKNPYLLCPKPETYKPWDSFKAPVTYPKGLQATLPTVEHYYGYWQVHYLYYIQQFPDLYKNYFLLEQISEEIKKRYHRPWRPRQADLREFNGLVRIFDILSFWITIYNRERNKIFALAPEEHQVKHLDPSQVQTYQKRIAADAELVKKRYEVNVDDLYESLRKLFRLYESYRTDERYKLSYELRNDIIYQAYLIEALTGKEWEAIAEELGKRFRLPMKRAFRHLDISIKEADEAHELLTDIAGEYAQMLANIGIPNLPNPFSTSEIDEFIDYCIREELSILLNALSGMSASGDELAEKFRRVFLYTHLKNALTALEFLL